jgi:PAS domain-containing protein
VTPPELNDDLRVVHAIPAPIWRSAPDGAVQCVNQQWMDYTGLSQENSQGWGWVSVIQGGYPERATDLMLGSK